MRRGLLRSHTDFRRVFAAGAASQLGTQVSMLAVPLIAVLTLHASTLQIGVLIAFETAALPIVGLPAGAWIDRMRRRPVLIASDLVRAALLCSIPIAAALRALSLGQLCAVVFTLGIGTVFFDVAHQSYLPALVGRDHLVEANSRIEGSRSVASFAGPTLAGYLVQALTAPYAILVDALSFVWSAGWIGAIHDRETPPPRPPSPVPLRRQIGEGLRLVLGDPVLRALILNATTMVFFWSWERAIEVVFLVRTVHLSAGQIGLIYGIASLGAVLSAFCAAPIARRIGRARTIVGAGIVTAGSLLLMPLTAPGPRVGFFVLGCALISFSVVAFNVVAGALRQQLCPNRLLGRMNATARFLAWSGLPIGSMLGGLLGTAIGLRPTMWISAAGGLLSVGWLLASPLRHAGYSPESDVQPAVTS